MTSTEEILDQIDNAVYDWEVGPDAMRCGGPTTMQRPQSVALFVRIDVRPFIEAMESVARAVAAFDWSALEQLVKAIEGLRPEHLPDQLCIDGHAYRRRQLARRRRR